jgi:hypothetical protein
MKGIVEQFLKRDARTFDSTSQVSLLKLYGSLDKPIAEIRIILDRAESNKE